MPKCLIKSILISEVVKLMVDYYKISEMEALDKFYKSYVSACLDDIETGLYGQSALYIFELIKNS